MKHLIALFYLIFITVHLFGNDQSEIIISEYLKAGIQIIIDPRLNNVNIIDQEDSYYDLAYKFSNNDDYELRIGLYPRKFIFRSNSEPSLEELKKIMWGITLSAGCNISQKSISQPLIKFFPDNAVRQEFGADVGTTNSVWGNSKFSGPYKIIIINSFYKFNSQYVVVYHLFKDFEVYKKMLESGEYEKIFHCIKYKS